MPSASSYYPFGIGPFCSDFKQFKGDFITILKFCIEVRTERMRFEKTNCQVSVAHLQMQIFFCLQKSTFLPSHQNRYQIAVKINQTSLVANTEELNSHLRHKYRDKCGELAPISSLGNMSLCELPISQ